MAMAKISLVPGAWTLVSTALANVSFTNSFLGSPLPNESVFVYEAASLPTVPGQDGDEVVAGDRYEASSLTQNLYCFVYGNAIDLVVQRG